MTLKAGIKILLVGFFLWMDAIGFAQFYAEGTIYYTRRTNLEKRFTDQRMKRFVTEDNKIKNDRFSLTFNDTISVFKYLPPTTTDEMAWLTSKNEYYQYLNPNKQLTIFQFFGTSVYVKDSLPIRPWKITDSKRTICGFNCRKAIYEKNDSTRIYAWYAPNILPSIGPEGFCGLPGTILGIATEDGGIIYFADKVDFSVAPKTEALAVDLGKNKLFTLKELREKLEKDYGNTPWGKRMFDDMFRWL
ncbi:MAG: GLPGLI family protein [Flavobacteriales bacterium]